MSVILGVGLACLAVGFAAGLLLSREIRKQVRREGS